MTAPAQVRVDCARAAVVGLRWRPVSAARSYAVLRDGTVIGRTALAEFADTSVGPDTSHRYAIAAIDAVGRSASSDPLDVRTPPRSAGGDAPYCPSPVIESLQWQWSDAARAADGSDLWPVTWGREGQVVAFFGDGGGFEGDDRRGRASFGIAEITGGPPLAAATAVNVYGGFAARQPSALSGKLRSLIAVGDDLYGIGGIYRPGDAKYGPPPVSGSPPHVEIVYSRRGAQAWRAADWSFCPSDTEGMFCPSGFVNVGPGNAGAPDRFVYLFGSSPTRDRQAQDASPVARTFLARVPRDQLLVRGAYRFFAGFDRRSKPVWNADPATLQPVFVDRNPPRSGCRGDCGMAGTLEEAVFDPGIGRYLGVAQADSLAQTAFYDAPHPWGPWTTVEYDNIDPVTGGGGWGDLGLNAGGSLGVHPVGAWLGAQGLSLWVFYSSDGKAPPGARFPASGRGLDALHVVPARIRLRQ